MGSGGVGLYNDGGAAGAGSSAGGGAADSGPGVGSVGAGGGACGDDAGVGASPVNPTFAMSLISPDKVTTKRFSLSAVNA